MSAFVNWETVEIVILFCFAGEEMGCGAVISGYLFLEHVDVFQVF